jgi:hypothetical protein
MTREEMENDMDIRMAIIMAELFSVAHPRTFAKLVQRVKKLVPDP